MLKELVEYIVVHLVNNTDAVSVAKRYEDQKVIIDIKIDSDDFKRVIGKEGRIIKSIRNTVSQLTPSGMVDVNLDAVS